MIILRYFDLKNRNKLLLLCFDIGWWYRHFSNWYLDFTWQIIHRSTITEQFIYVISVYNDHIWKYINIYIYYRLNRCSKGMFTIALLESFHDIKKLDFKNLIKPNSYFHHLQETKCLLLTYFIFLFLLFVVLLVGGVIAYVFRHQVSIITLT